MGGAQGEHFLTLSAHPTDLVAIAVNQYKEGERFQCLVRFEGSNFVADGSSDERKCMRGSGCARPMSLFCFSFQWEHQVLVRALSADHQFGSPTCVEVAVPFGGEQLVVAR